jgi:hypothetical protein
MGEDGEPNTGAIVQPEAPRVGGVVPWVTRALALLTAPAAAILLVFGLGAVMGTTACADRRCPSLPLGGIGYAGLLYGAPIAALLTIVVSFFVATHWWGIIVPVLGWALLIADVVVLVASFPQ